MRRILIPLAASVLLAASAATPALAQTPAAPQAVGDVQLVVIADHGDLLNHTIRHADRTWQRFGDVASVLGPRTVAYLTLAGEG